MPVMQPQQTTVPTYRGHLLMGALPEVNRDQLGFMQELSKMGDMVRVRFGPMWYVFLQHPDHIKHVLVDNHRNYDKQTRGYDKLKLVLGNGLVTSEGDFWRRQRRIAQPAFHHERLSGFARIMGECADQLATRWAQSTGGERSEEHTSELQSLRHLVCRLLLEKKKQNQ